MNVVPISKWKKNYQRKFAEWQLLCYVDQKDLPHKNFDVKFTMVN